jgi:hypothetical protein
MKRALLFLLITACQNAPKGEPAPSASTTPAASASPAPAPAPVPEKPWFEGAWQGTFSAELFRIELPAGNVKEWKTDDGKQASGPGELSLEVAADGTVSGSAKGALGELSVSGRVEGDRAALSLAPVTPGGFQGVILAARAGDGLKGALSASSGDSLQVRRADVTLSRAAK